MLRLCSKAHRSLYPLRFISSSSSSSLRQSQIPHEYPKDVQNPQHIPSPSPSPSPILRLPNSASLPSRASSLFVLSATLISAVLLSAVFISNDEEDKLKRKPNVDLEDSIEKSRNSFKKIMNRMKQTGVTATVLWTSLRSVLSSANHEVRSGFELRVAAFLADIAAANEGRRSAIVGAGGGVVVDWLLETVGSMTSRDNCETQCESARALAHLIADVNVCEAVLGRPHAVPNLLKFIFSYQPQYSKKQSTRSSFDGTYTSKGRSMLVAVIMDIVTTNCDNLDKSSFQPSLSANADIRDIAAAIEVIEEGGMHFDESHGSEDDDNGGKGMRGIGIKILGGTTVLGLARTEGGLKVDHHPDAKHSESKYKPTTLLFRERHDGSQARMSLASLSVPGLWDDLQSQHVAVPFAAWALANWAMASNLNRSHIQELDQDGHAVMTTLIAPERTVKWHGSLVARLLLEDHNIPLVDSVCDWSSSLLSTTSHACENEDIPLALVALSAFLVSLERSPGARNTVMDKGLHLMRDISKLTEKHGNVQEALAKALELLCTGDEHLSLEDSQKWSSILLHWACGKFSSDSIRLSAMKILSSVLEDYGPSSIPISQGWLTILLTEILSSSKTTVKGNTNSKSNKIQIDQSNALSAAQIANLLAGAVVNLATKQLGQPMDSVDASPLLDLLSSGPFAAPFKNLTKTGLPKFDAADSAVATLKGVKALANVCNEDSLCQQKMADLGVLCLLRRFLLKDDYEQLAAIEAYDASKVLETQERASETSGEAPSLDSDDSSSVRLPPTAHIRRHAARLLNILSVLPKIQKAIIADETWCKWLDDCANGRIPGCNDLKIQSYARAILLNIFCPEQIDDKISSNNVPEGVVEIAKRTCPRYDDMIFLINPERPHWNCSIENVSESAQNSSVKKTSESENCSPHDVPQLDIVFVHGLRGGPFKTWRIADDKSSTTSKSGLVEKIDEEAGKQGTCWPREWLAADFPEARLFTVKFKTNLTQWSGASLPLQEVSSMLLKKLVSAGIGSRPVVFVTHSMGGLVVKEMLYEAKMDNLNSLVKNTVGMVFYSCPHFGSRLADMPWRMGLVLRPAPTIGELRSGSPRLVELNDFIRRLHGKGSLDVLSFSETKVTPIVEGYGGWAFRMEIVPIESAYPGFGELVVLESTDHINSCKPVSRSDPSYKEMLNFLQKLKVKHYLMKEIPRGLLEACDRHSCTNMYPVLYKTCRNEFNYVISYYMVLGQGSQYCQDEPTSEAHTPDIMPPVIHQVIEF